jgi:hypothetical protein
MKLAIGATALAVFCVGIAVGRYSSPAQVLNSDSIPAVAIPNAPPVRRLPNDVSGLGGMVARVDPADGAGAPARREIQAEDQASESSSAAVSDDDSTDSSSDATDESAQLEGERRSAIYNDALVRAAPDPAWSAATIQHIEQRTQNSSVAGTMLSDIRCQGALCRIDAAHDTFEAEHEFVAQLTEMDEFRGGQAAVLHVDRGDGSVGTTIFITREGQELPQVD